MRIIAGRLGGRNFASPHGHRTHPMSDKMRGAIFGVLGDIKGLTVFDPFSGSGALAFEAVSRGASTTVATEVDKAAHTAIVQNIEELGVSDRVTAVRANASAWSNRHPDQQFDLLLVDPPYDALQYKILRKLTRHVRPNGLYVLSLPAKHETLKFETLELVQHKDYGDAQLVFYRRIA